MKGTLPSTAMQHVRVRLDGHLINDVIVGADWQRLAIVLPGGDPTKPRRIELDISPTAVRIEGISASDDGRVVGVQVGELNVVR